MIIPGAPVRKSINCAPGSANTVLAGLNGATSAGSRMWAASGLAAQDALVPGAKMNPTPLAAPFGLSLMHLRNCLPRWPQLAEARSSAFPSLHNPATAPSWRYGITSTQPLKRRPSVYATR